LVSSFRCQTLQSFVTTLPIYFEDEVSEATNIKYSIIN
jgi:hypothetical protein